MSVLRAIRMSRVHPVRVTLTASQSTLPGSPPSLTKPVQSSSTTPAFPEFPSEEVSAMPTNLAFFDDLKKTADPVIEEDSLPPAAPATAYGAPNPPNPIANTRHVKDILTSERPKYGFYIKATRNNTITTFTRPNGNPIVGFSGGKCGFKGQKRATYEAGYQCAVRSFEAIEKIMRDEPKMQIALYMNGFGQGRDAVYRALMASEGEMVRPLVSRVTDVTPIKIGGTRAKKMRRT